MFPLDLFVSGMLLLPLLLIGGGVVWAIRVRRRRMAAVLALPAVLYAGWCIDTGSVPGFDWYHDLRFTRQVTGKAFTLQSEIARHETPRSWHGDGYSVHVYRLAAPAAAHFRSPARIASFPARGGWRSDWQIRSWASTRSAPPDVRLLAFAVSPAPAWLQTTIAEALARPTTSYAYFYKQSAGAADADLLNVDLFVADPVARRLYIINHNT